MLSGLLAGLKDWPRFFGAVAITLLSLMAWIPTLLFIHVNSTLWDDLSVIETSGSAVLIVATLLTTLWSAFKRERLLFLAELDSVNSQISRANKIKSQMNWVSARAWTYLIHGGVQSSLSIANYKLRAASKIDIDVLADVIKDLEHAKRLLEAGVVPFESWRERISSLKGAWKGVCVVSFDQSDEALEVVTSDATASSCISEVCKELVSNAFRHGGATKIRFSLTLAKPGELLLESSNNGNPLPEKVTHGLGIELYRELTSSYDLRNEDSSVVFSGLFPFDSGARPKQTEAI
jgi:signal transduction histidine kinase